MVCYILAIVLDEICMANLFLIGFFLTVYLLFSRIISFILGSTNKFGYCFCVLFLLDMCLALALVEHIGHVLGTCLMRHINTC